MDTCLSSKVVSQNCETISPMAVDAVLGIIDPLNATNVDLRDIKVYKLCGIGATSGQTAGLMAWNIHAIFRGERKMPTSPTNPEPRVLFFLCVRACTQICKQLGGTIDDSELVHGMVFEKGAKKSAGGPTRIENAKVSVYIDSCCGFRVVLHRFSAPLCPGFRLLSLALLPPVVVLVYGVVY